MPRRDPLAQSATPRRPAADLAHRTVPCLHELARRLGEALVALARTEARDDDHPARPPLH